VTGGCIGERSGAAAQGSGDDSSGTPTIHPTTMRAALAALRQHLQAEAAGNLSQERGSETRECFVGRSFLEQKTSQIVKSVNTFFLIIPMNPNLRCSFFVAIWASTIFSPFC